ncbi:MAG: hypothetical protein ACE5OW_06920 [Candidatus Bathyarchaeia archaeon]
MGVFEFAKTVVDYVTKKREISTDELKKMVPERRLYDILAVLEAAGLIERAKTRVRWLGGSVGKQILIEGLIDTVTTSPTEVEIVGAEPLKVKIKGL